MDDQRILKSIDNKLSTLIALTAIFLTGGMKDAKLEVLLKDNGLEVAEIAKILNKQVPAVRKAIQRAK